MIRGLKNHADSLVSRVAIVMALGASLYSAPAFAQTTCPVTPSELEAIIDNENDPAVRTEAAECFVQKATEFSYSELKQVVHKMLDDDEAADVRLYGLFNFAASYLGGQSTGSDLWRSKTQIIKAVIEDPVADNKAAAAELLGSLDPIPEDQIEAPLLALLFHSDPTVVGFAFKTLMRFKTPPVPEIDDAFRGKMAHSNPRQRSVAARALGLLYRSDPSVDPALIAALASALSDDDTNVKIQAARSLERFGAQAASAAPNLAAIVWDPKQPPHIRKVAQEAEEAITGQPTRPPWLGQTPTPPHPGNAGGSR